jgi:hypothetical protein
MPDSFLVLSRDGTVLDVPDNVPRAWVGTRIEDTLDIESGTTETSRGTTVRFTLPVVG